MLAEMSSRTNIQAKQKSWAQSRGLLPDEQGYLSSFAENLFEPLSPEGTASFTNGSGNELVSRDGVPAKMRALHSSSALAINVFHYWCQSPDSVLNALNLGAGGLKVKFETQFPTGLTGNPPNLDVCVWRADGSIVGIESKFTEWLTAKPAGKEHFKPKYFPVDRALWASHGLPGCQRTAQALVRQELTFRYLDAPQLLKHALGLANSKLPFELCYLYYEARVPEAEVHRRELEEFRTCIRGDFDFHVLTYQDVFERLRAAATIPADSEYVAYLAARYFS
jgi:hypothetical protein